MKKRRIAVFALLLVGLLVLSSCTFSFGNLSEDTPEEVQDPGGDVQGPGADPGESGDDSEQPGENTEVPGQSGSLSLSPRALDMPVGRSIALVTSNSGTGLSWTSSNPGVAAVNQDGLVSALAEGESIVTATANGNSAVCRVSVIADGPTLAYPNDPGPIPTDPDGERVPPQGEPDEDNTPTEVPEDSNEIPLADQVTWTILIDDSFDAELTVPGGGFSYMVNTRVALLAEKEGGTTALGIYQGTIQVDMAIDEESFIAAVNALGGEPITGFSSNISSQAAEVTFSVDEYDSETMVDANAAYSSGNIPPMVHPLITPQGMVVSSFMPSVVQSITIEGQDGFGSAVGGGVGETPFLIEISSSGAAKLYMPRMLSMMTRNTFNGRLVKRAN